jgi:hypothetical protein
VPTCSALGARRRQAARARAASVVGVAIMLCLLLVSPAHLGPRPTRSQERSRRRPRAAGVSRQTARI